MWSVIEWIKLKVNARFSLIVKSTTYLFWLCYGKLSDIILLTSLCGLESFALYINNDFCVFVYLHSQIKLMHRLVTVKLLSTHISKGPPTITNMMTTSTWTF